MPRALYFHIPRGASNFCLLSKYIYFYIDHSLNSFTKIKNISYWNLVWLCWYSNLCIWRLLFTLFFCIKHHFFVTWKHHFMNDSVFFCLSFFVVWMKGRSIHKKVIKYNIKHIKIYIDKKGTLWREHEWLYNH